MLSAEVGKSKKRSRCLGNALLCLAAVAFRSRAFVSSQFAPASRSLRHAAAGARSGNFPVVDAEEVSSAVIVGSANASRGDGFEGKVAVITGASTGIGLATVEGMARSGMYGRIILAGRNAAKHDTALESLRQTLVSLQKPVELRRMDLELDSLSSVRSFAEQFLELKMPLHTLVLNAGVMAVPVRQLTKDGNEYQFGVNHLGHFLLANLLLDHVVASSAAVDPGRVISLSSSAHQFPSALLRGDLHDLQSEEYTAWGAYGQSKLANVIFAYELDRRCRDKGLPVAVNAVHPGVVSTELARYLAGSESGGGGLGLPFGLQELAKPLLSYVLKSTEDGAKTSILLATQSEGKLSGRYWQDCRPAASIDFDPIGDLPSPAKALLPLKPRFTSYNPKVWFELWKDSEILAGLRPEDVKCLNLKD